MLADILTTNEIKDTSGAECEFQRIKSGDWTTEFAATANTPASENKLIIKHEELGTGNDKRRRSLIRFEIEEAGTDGRRIKSSTHVVCDIPIGNVTTLASVKKTIAQAQSFLASLGATSTILHDCTGNGAVVMVNGTL